MGFLRFSGSEGQFFILFIGCVVVEAFENPGWNFRVIGFIHLFKFEVKGGPLK